MLLPGPLATLIMADLGAEVIKVEPPGGDYARHMKSFLFEGSNRNKSSIVVDLKAPDAKDIIKRLAEYGDVAIEVSSQFCHSHGIDEQFVPVLAETIQQQIDASTTNADTQQNNNKNTTNAGGVGVASACVE